MAEFNQEFDKEVNEHLVFTIQQCIGCFQCGKGIASVGADNKLQQSPDFPKHQCSKCSVARYCNVDCQRKAWRTIHKEECAMYCQNRDAGHFCVAECLNGSGWLSPDVFDTAMRNRKEAFLQTLYEMKESINFFLTVAVIPALGGALRFVIAVRFTDSKHLPIDVNHLVYESIDKGEKSIALINQGSGELSPAALERVYQHTETFCDELVVETRGKVTSLTLGRGLVNKGKEFEERLKPISDSIITMPSMDYVMSDMMDATMSATFK